MPFLVPPNRAYGTLGATYTSGAGTLTLASGHGSRFGAIAAGAFFWILIEDTSEASYLRYMIAKCTAIATDNLSITPAEEGTSNSNFPITPGNPIQKVRVYAATSKRQLLAMMSGGGAVIQATAPTLTLDSPENIILTPAAPITVTLPTTGVWAGKRFVFINLGSAANTITVNASGGTTVAVIPGGTNEDLIAYQDTPTTNAHWGPPAVSLTKTQTLTNKTLTSPTVTGTIGGSPIITTPTITSLLGSGGTTTYAFPDVAARTINVSGVDQNSYVSASGHIGTDATAEIIGTANSSPATITLKGNSLNAPLRGIRIKIILGITHASALTVFVTLNGVTLSTWAPATIGAYAANAIDVYYVDGTHCHTTGCQMNIGAGSGLIGDTTGPQVNLAGFANAADQLISVHQVSIASTHAIVYAMFVEPLG